MGKSRRERDLEPVSDVLQSLFPNRRFVKPNLGAIRRVWPDLLGTLAGRTRVVHFEKGELVVEVESAAWMTELTFLKNELIEKLCAAGIVVSAIRFRVGRRRSPRPTAPREKTIAPEKQERIDRLTASVSDDEVREALRRLLKSSVST